MKKKISLNKKTIKRLTLKLGKSNDRKVAPAALVNPMSDELAPDPTNGFWCTFRGQCV
jgi:hypothetical protein